MEITKPDKGYRHSCLGQGSLGQSPIGVEIMSTQIVSGVVVDQWFSKSLTRNRALIRDVTLAIALAVVTGLCAQVSIPLPFTPVPLTLQTLAVLAGAAAFGAARATSAQIIYIAFAFAGLPVLAPQPDGSHTVGKAILQIPTLGYLVGFVVASFVVGKIAERGITTNPALVVHAYIAGSAVIYLLGASWLAHAIEVPASKALELGVTPFLMGDLLKAYLAGVLVPGLWKIAGRS